MHKTTILCQFGLFCHQLTTISRSILNHFWWELYQINKSHCSTPKLTSRIKDQFKRERLMPSPEVIDLTLSNDEIQPDPIRSDQGTSMPTQASNRFRLSSSTSPTSGITELGEFFQSFKVLLQPSNELKIISHSNLSSTTPTLDKHSSTASTTNTGLVYLSSILWRPASTHTLKTDLSQKSL